MASEAMGPRLRGDDTREDVADRAWVAESDDIPLVTEADTYEILCGKLPDLIQDVLINNGDSRAGKDVPLELVTHSSSFPRTRVA